MKKLILLMFVMVFLVGSVSALELNPFADKKNHELNQDNVTSNYLKETFNEKYGVIQISNTFFWFETDRIIEYSLTENTEQCTINCEAEGRTTLYSDGTLFEGKEFIAVNDVEMQLNNSQYWIGVDTIEQVNTYEQQCILSSNETSLDCSWVVNGTKDVVVNSWEVYNYEELKAGDYRWKLTGEKEYGQNIDFRIKTYGKTLNEWAWWNGTGGTETFDGGFTIQTFTSSGQFMWAGNDSNVSVLVVAGGGAGGGTDGGGGGGAGGMLVNTTYFISAGNFTITVGTGGDGVSGGQGNNGTNSSFSTLNAGGGGGGGLDFEDGLNGGSGGGEGFSADTGLGTPGQGNDGGDHIGGHGVPGGGGAGAVGSDGQGAPGDGGAGGNGTQSNINGTNIFYAGGGGGASFSQIGGIGGAGGGGSGGNTSEGVDAVDGLGGGGGGSERSGGPFAGGDGGDGIVIFRFVTATDPPPTGITITLNEPANDATTTNPTILFNGTGTDDTDLVNMSLYVNETLQVTNSSVFNNTLTDFSHTFSQSGFFNWTIQACDNTGACENATSRNITFQNDLSITLNLPNNDDDFLVLTNSFNGTGSDDTTLQNMSLYVNGSLISTNSSPLNNTLTNFEHTAITIGFFNWTLGVCDNNGACENATERNFTISSNVNATLNQPINAFNSTTQLIIFNGTGSDDTSLANISFILNATYNGTNTSVFNDTLTQFPRTLADGFYNWTIEVCDDLGICINATARNITFDSTLPLTNITFPFNNTAINFHNSSVNQTINWTATDDNLDSCWIDYDFTNRTVTCNVNTSSFELTSQRNVTFWINDTFGNENFSIVFWDYLVLQHLFTFNASAFETSPEEFTMNITTNGTAPSSSSLIYNGTTFTGVTITNTVGNDYNLTRSIDIPIQVGTKSFFFNITTGGIEVNGSSNNQLINLTNFSNCQASPQTTPFINLTFKNETTAEEDVNSTIVSTWTYSLGTLSITNKTFIFSNTTENTNYTFCSTPENRSINIDLAMTYSNSISQQRAFTLVTTLLNTSTTQVLYLLPTANGLLSPFTTVDILGRSISSVRGIVTRTLNGNPITVASGFTDGSGFIDFFLDPNVLYTGSFSKTGFQTATETFFPVADLRTVTMASSLFVSNGSEISLNGTYEITPINTTLLNNTDVTFGFNVTSGQTITLISLNITNITGSELLFVSNAGQGFISGVLNTSNNTRLIGEFIIQTDNETLIYSKVWTIFNFFPGDYSIFTQFDFYNDYGFSDFIRLLIVLITIVSVLIFMTAGEVLDTSESKIIVSLLLVWAFSIVGWLDTNIIVSGASTQLNTLAVLSNQYGIAMLTTGAGLFFVLRRIFI